MWMSVVCWLNMLNEALPRILRGIFLPSSSSSGNTQGEMEYTKAVEVLQQ
eukprot:gene8604-17914_t